VIDCHYRRLAADGEFQVFESTDGTRSNWDREIQHGSPPLALMTKLIEEQAADSGLRVGRLTLDILGAIPVTQVRVRTWVERPGSRISMLAAQMSAPRPVTPPMPQPTAIRHWWKASRCRCRAIGTPADTCRQ
jgi:hypothetical protein